MAEDISSTILTNATKPAEVTVDGQTAKQHPIPDQIAADRYAKSKSASSGTSFPLRRFRISPPGAV